jgi:hypothetical protein
MIPTKLPGNNRDLTNENIRIISIGEDYPSHYSSLQTKHYLFDCLIPLCRKIWGPPSFVTQRDQNFLVYFLKLPDAHLLLLASKTETQYYIVTHIDKTKLNKNRQQIKEFFDWWEPKTAEYLKYQAPHKCAVCLQRNKTVSLQPSRSTLVFGGYPCHYEHRCSRCEARLIRKIDRFLDH